MPIGQIFYIVTILALIGIAVGLLIGAAIVIVPVVGGGALRDSTSTGECAAGWLGGASSGRAGFNVLPQMFRADDNGG